MESTGKSTEPGPPAAYRAISKPWALVLSGLLGLHIAIFGSSLLPGRVPDGDDTFHQCLPSLEFNRRSYRRGELPLWNPHILCGQPHAAGAVSSSFYPLSLLAAFLPVEIAYSWSMLMSLAAAGMAAYALARRWGHSPCAAAIAGIIYSAGGMTVPRVLAGHLAGIWSLPYLPLVILLVDRLFEGRRRPLDTGLLGLALGGSVLAGNPPGTIVILAGGAGYALWRLGALWRRELAGRTSEWAGPPSARDVGRTVGLGLLAGLVGAMVAACQVLTTMGILDETGRSGGLGADLANAFSFPPEGLLTLASPGLFGYGVNGQYWGWSFAWEACCYASLAGLALAAYGAVRAGGVGRTRLLLAATGLSVAFGLGEHLGATTLLFRLAPFTTMMRTPNRIILVAQLALALLAAEGVTRLARDSCAPQPPPALRAFRRIVPAVAGLVALVTVAVYLGGPLSGPFRGAVRHMLEGNPYARFTPHALHPRTVACMHSATVSALLTATALAALAAALFWSGASPKLRGRAAVLAAALVIADLAWTMSGFVVPKATDDHGWSAEIIRAVRPPEGGRSRVAVLGSWYRRNVGALIGIDTVNGYDQLVSRRLSLVGFRMEGLPDLPARANFETRRYHPLLEVMAADYVLAPSAMPTPDHLVPVTHGSGGLRLYRNPTALPRAYLAYSPRSAASEAEALRMFTTGGFDPRKEVLLEGPPRGLPVLDFVPAKPSIDPARIVSYERGCVQISCEAAGPAMLVLCDAYSAGWHAAVDGQPVAIHRANYLFRGVAVPQGRHTVVFEYDPPEVRWGVALTALGLAAASALVAAGFFRAKRQAF